MSCAVQLMVDIAVVAPFAHCAVNSSPSAGVSGPSLGIGISFPLLFHTVSLQELVTRVLRLTIPLYHVGQVLRLLLRP